ncbi:hypothetical protein GpartN1_g4507.t1 [Galdieria partita]|uniref:EamA domain-containing protein n=1 Tax=Galdieria partita TaxID=83374 RepID=A0A9C7PUZ0_9RHOD|nr:hypothetical protein GpartN1_g2202.t1 [Galdieria partita]GJQ12716.1 hypothetical protein GpartN1_g4507.t1 [Galdieria partita]
MSTTFVTIRLVTTESWKNVQRRFCTNRKPYTSKTKFLVNCRLFRWFKGVTSSSLSLSCHNAFEKSWKLNYLLLHTVTIIWGTQHALIKYSLQYSSPELFNFVRFLLASLTFLPSLFFQSSRSSTEKNVSIFNSSLWLSGTELGFWLFLGFALQSVGLETTDANKGGFLLYLNVKFVPLILWLLYGRRISSDTWLSVFAAFLGTCLLSFDIYSYHISEGDIYCILAALASAMFIVRLSNAAQQYSAALLNVCSLWTVTICSLVWFGIEHISNLSCIEEQWKLIPTLIQHQWWCWLYLGCITTGLGNWLQTIAQKKVAPEKASVIYALDPLYGAIFSWWFLQETLSFQGCMGALFIIGAAIYSAKTS